MEPDRFDNVTRTLFITPSRRALTRALVGLATGSLLLRHGGVVAKDGHKTHKRKHHRKNKRKKNPGSRCPKNYEFCPADEYSQCCFKNLNPQYDPAEVCTDCGCCPFNASKCCASAGDSLCCGSNDKCCYADDFKSSACCGPTDVCCGAGCCNQGEACCTSTGENPFKYCCAKGLTCLPTGGKTCQ